MTAKAYKTTAECIVYLCEKKIDQELSHIAGAFNLIGLREENHKYIFFLSFFALSFCEASGIIHTQKLYELTSCICICSS